MPYKARIHRWVSPDLLKYQDVSASKAKKIITDYQKAIGRPEGLAELMVFYCERATDFSNAFSFADESYSDALVKIFEQALKISTSLPIDQRDALLDRLDDVRASATTSATGLAMKWVFSWLSIEMMIEHNMLLNVTAMSQGDRSSNVRRDR